MTSRGLVEANKPSEFRIGDREVAVLVPSRRQPGEPIDEGIRLSVAVQVQERLTELFGGASARVGRDSLRGSFKHNDDGTGRVTVEPDERIYCLVKEKTLANKRLRKAVGVIAAWVARELEQESVLVGWGAEHFVVGRSGGPSSQAHRPFRELRAVTQEQFAIAACARVRTVLDVRGILSLDGWSFIKDPGKDPKRRLAFSGDRQAFLIEAKERPELPADDDLAFAAAPDARGILVWARVGGQVRGPRLLPLGGAQPKRLSLQLALGLLGSPLVEPLGVLLDRDLATSAFFRRYAALRDRLAREMGRAHGPIEARTVLAQRYLGRLMFLRFLEARQWLKGDRRFLRQLFHTRGERRFSEVLDDLFAKLDEPDEDKRDGLPYLNGGLFHLPRSSPALPDEVFHSDHAESVFSLFEAYDFTLDESTAADHAVAVDPSMFGHVLECLREPGRRKSEGVVYTPRPIAHALAFESIVSRLAEVTRLSRLDLVRFARGAADTLTVPQAKVVHRALQGLRIVDPALGSGTLLVAALDVLMQIAQGCYRRRGLSLERGGSTWAIETRYFVSRCLYGVDIDGDAVEVARLRLWLSIAVGDREPEPLPDLARHLCVGDSLNSRRVDAALLGKGLWRREQSLLPRDDTSLDAYRRALDDYERGARRSGQAAAKAFEALQQEERRLFGKLKSITKPLHTSASASGVPFVWTVHFGEVFSSKNQGFDVVIANPPYVRTRNLAESYDDYESMKGNKDLYLAFVERALDLAGKAGQYAYVMPYFGERPAAQCLREVLAKRGAVERMVSFGGQQVFAGASNYVALLFGRSRRKAKKTTFEGGVVSTEAWRSARDTGWLEGVDWAPIRLSGAAWPLNAVGSETLLKTLERNSVPLGQLCEAHVGIQTGLDRVFLLEQVGEAHGGRIPVRSKAVKGVFEIEAGLLRPCAKGSVHLKPYRLLSGQYMLWPYEGTEPLKRSRLESEYPGGWAYLTAVRGPLESRASAHIRDGKWWGFGRSHGLERMSTPKLAVPAAQERATAYWDRTGTLATTSSGSGGGGAQLVFLKSGVADPAANLAWLLAVLNSPQLAAWIRVNGTSQLSGWRGLDRSTLLKAPIPRPNEEQLVRIQRDVEALILELSGPPSDGAQAKLLLERINSVVAEAFGAPPVKGIRGGLSAG